MIARYRLQLPPDGRYTEWRRIAPIPEAYILSVQFDREVTWEQSNHAMRILFGNVESLMG